ncbi:MAG: hypothetical protein ACE5I1_33420, partial [bacterium]
INSISADGVTTWFGHEPGTARGGGRITETSVNLLSKTDCFPQWLLSEVNVEFPSGIFPSISQYHSVNESWQYVQLLEAGPDTLRRERNYFSVLSSAANQDQVWFGTVSKGVILYDKSTETLSNFNSSNSGLVGNLVWSVAFDGADVWFGTFGQGVSRYSPPPELWKTYRKADGLVDESVESISIYKDEAWFGTHRGLSKLQISSNTWTNFTPQNSDIGTFAAWYVGVDSQFVWVGPSLRRYDKFSDTWAVIDTTESKLGNSLVFSIFVENDFVWFGASNGKISRYNKRNNSWMLFDSTVTKLQGTIYSIDIVEDELWAADRKIGVSSYDKVSNTWARFDTLNSRLASHLVTSIAIDGDLVWFTTFGKGIGQYNKKTNEWRVFDGNNTGLLFLNTLWAVAADGDFIWFGSHSRGIYRYEKSSGTWENFSDLTGHLAARRVRDIEVGNRFVWISAFDENFSVTPTKRTGGVSRFGDVSAPSLVHAPVTIEQPSMQPVLIIAS